MALSQGMEKHTVDEMTMTFKVTKIIGGLNAPYSRIHSLTMCSGPKPGPSLSIGSVGIYAANIAPIMIADYR